MEEVAVQCPSCHTTLNKEWYFCPNCGKKIHEPPESTTVGRQIVVYLVSIFLPPLGLWPAVKYLRQKDPKAKWIGVAAIVLTVVSTVVSIWLSVQMVNEYTQMLDTQMRTYQQMGL